MHWAAPSSKNALHHRLTRQLFTFPRVRDCKFFTAVHVNNRSSGTLFLPKMFVDESLAPVEFKSQWKKERYVRDSDTQTKELSTAEAASQSIKRKHREVQTDSDENKQFEVVDDETPELYDFLRYAEGIVIEELKKTVNSHAFDGYDVTWEEERDTVTVLHTLNFAELNGQMQITGLDWNATGSTVCASYGRFDHEDWCTHRSALCTWNIDRRGLNPDKPDTTIDIPTCLMCISCHPQNPSLIAGGTFNGEVLVWDLSRDDDMLIASSGIGDDSHREPVSKVHWTKDTESKSRKYNVVSVSGDGKILVWKMHKTKQQLKLTDGFILLTESLPRWMQVRSRHGGQEMGVTCLSYSPNDPTTFLVGSESGAICRCSTETRGTTATGVNSSVPLQSPVTLTFNPHHGPVYSVCCSPFHRNLFLSCSTDTSARVYTMLQTDPMITTEPGAGYLYSAKWSPVRPLVFAVGTEDSQLLLYDLKYSTGIPRYKLDSSPTKKPVYAVQFNPKQEKLLATGDGIGTILVWQLNDQLTQQGAHETEILDDIAKTALE